MADVKELHSKDSTKCRETLDELKQLKIKIASLEKEKTIYNHKVVSNLLHSLASEETKLDKKRHNEKFELQRKIERIKVKVGMFRDMLKDTTRTNPSSVEKIKESLEDIENTINLFKDKQKETYEELLIQERLVWQEITAYKRQIEGWTTTATTTTGGESHVANWTGHVTCSYEEEEEEEDRQGIAPKAVTAFQSFLYQRGGHTGGWEELDHNVFVKLWNKHKGVEESLIEEAVREIPSQSHDIILHHIAWYKEYVTLKESHKLAINEWRQKREVERKKSLVSEMKRKEEKREEIKEKKTAQEKLKEKEREETKKKLEQWKQYQLTLKQANAEKDELRKRNEAIKEKRKQDRQALIKLQALEYSKLREEEKRKRQLLEMAQAEEQKEKAKTANKHIQYFQHRDMLTLQAKQDLLASQEHEQEMKKIQLEKIKKSVEVKVERDPSRLLQPTSVWVEKQKTDTPGLSTGPLLSIPKRATPSWRQNI